MNFLDLARSGQGYHDSLKPPSGGFFFCENNSLV